MLCGPPQIMKSGSVADLYNLEQKWCRPLGGRCRPVPPGAMVPHHSAGHGGRPGPSVEVGTCPESPLALSRTFLRSRITDRKATQSCRLKIKKNANIPKMYHFSNEWAILLLLMFLLLQNIGETVRGHYRAITAGTDGPGRRT